MKSKLALLLLAGFGVSLAQAQTDVSGRLSQQDRNYFSSGGGPIMTTATATVSAAPGSVDNFVALFNFVGDTSFCVTLTAPRGKLIRVRAPAAYGGATFGVTVQTSAFSATGDIIVSSTPQFLRGTGTVPALSTTARLTGSGGEGFLLVTSDSLTADQNFTFKAIKFVVQVPAAHDVVSDDPFTSFQVGGSASGFTPVEPLPDPGQWIRIIDDPVVKSLEKKVGKLKRRLRAQKRRGDSAGARKTKKKIRKLQKRIRRLG